MLIISNLSHTHDVSKFDCGNQDLNHYLVNIAKQHITKNISAVSVLFDPNNATKVIGYISLSFCEITPKKNIPSQLIRKYKYPKHTLPAARLGRLAVNKKYQGYGYGKKLLIHALYKSYLVGKEIPITGIIVDAKDKQSRIFYEEFDFVCITKRPTKLFLDVNVINSLF